MKSYATKHLIQENRSNKGGIHIYTSMLVDFLPADLFQNLMSFNKQSKI